jgi:hypothetical protein
MSPLCQLSDRHIILHKTYSGESLTDRMLHLQNHYRTREDSCKVRPDDCKHLAESQDCVESSC